MVAENPNSPTFCILPSVTISSNGAKSTFFKVTGRLCILICKHRVSSSLIKK